MRLDIEGRGPVHNFVRLFLTQINLRKQRTGPGRPCVKRGGMRRAGYKREGGKKSTESTKPKTRKAYIGPAYKSTRTKEQNQRVNKETKEKNSTVAEGAVEVRGTNEGRAGEKVAHQQQLEDRGTLRNARRIKKCTTKPCLNVRGKSKWSAVSSRGNKDGGGGGGGEIISRGVGGDILLIFRLEGVEEPLIERT